MNREIKFRAWDGKRMHSQQQLVFCGKNYLETIGGKALMQFTGLKDKNGKEIYEGDIVSCDQVQGFGKVVGIVHFGIDYRESSGWADPRIYLDTRQFQKHNGSEFCIFHVQPDVIGNIYENPELLNS